MYRDLSSIIAKNDLVSIHKNNKFYFTGIVLAVNLNERCITVSNNGYPLLFKMDSTCLNQQDLFIKTVRVPHKGSRVSRNIVKMLAKRCRLNDFNCRKVKEIHSEESMIYHGYLMARLESWEAYIEAKKLLC